MTERRTNRDFARIIRRMVDEWYPDAEKVVLAVDNLSTHSPAALYEEFEPAEDDVDDRPQLSALYHRALELVRGEFEPSTWTAFWRVTVDGQATADVARDLGVGSATVRQAKSRVLRRLKQEFGDLIE